MGYGFVAVYLALVGFAYFFNEGVFIALTFPWSVFLIAIGFFLIHVTSHGIAIIDFGSFIGATLNAATVLYLTRRRKTE